MAWLPLSMLTAPSYQRKTLNEVQRCVNLYPEKTEDGWRLVSSPGLSLAWTTANNLNCQAAYLSTTGKLFSLHGDVIYETQSGSGPASRGTVTLGNAPCTFADDGTTLFIVDFGGTGHTLTMTSGSVTAVADADFPLSSMVTFQDGYFIVAKQDAHQFYISARGSATSWDALDFDSAEAKGDILTGIISNGTTLFLIGKRTVELWYNTRNPDFPFERISGSIFQFGSEAKQSIATLNGNVYFLGNSEGGKGAVWAFEGSTPRRITTEYLESIFQHWDVSNVYGSCYQIDGKSFYQLSATGDDKTFVYDIADGVWHERDSNVSGYTSIRFNTAINAFASSGYRNPIAFSRINGAIYLLGGSPASPANSDAGTDIRRLRIFGPIEAGGRRIFHHGIRFVMEAEHDSSASYALSMTLEYSDDAGATWSTALTLSKAITSGTTAQRVMLERYRLGSSRQRFYRITFTGPAAKLVLQSAEIDYEIGAH